MGLFVADRGAAWWLVWYESMVRFLGMIEREREGYGGGMDRYVCLYGGMEAWR